MLNTIYARKTFGLTIVAIGLMLTYQFVYVDMKFFEYAMHIRTPKLLSILIAAFCIGYATIVFQTVINNRIVTPCLLGMNSLYILIHTAVAFIFGTASIFVTNKNITFTIDIIMMSILATIIYGYLFKKTKFNVLYVLLAGTVMATLFTSMSNTMIRILEPNEYDVLLTSLIAGFSHVNYELIYYAVGLIIVIAIIFAKEIKLLNVLVLGRNQAINLGINYDKTVMKLLIGVTLLITIATALVGPISFLGLIIANVSRELFKTHRHNYLMFGSFLAGVIVLLAGQILIEHVFNFSTVIPVFINFFGGIYFIYLITKNKGI